jgi:hypothetical protein
MCVVTQWRRVCPCGPSQTGSLSDMGRRPVPSLFLMGGRLCCSRTDEDVTHARTVAARAVAREHPSLDRLDQGGAVI